MAKARFVLRYTGDGDTPEADVERVRALGDTAIVDSSPKMLLVDSEPDSLQTLVDGLPGWMLAPQHHYAVPDTRERVERPPDPPT